MKAPSDSTAGVEIEQEPLSPPTIPLLPPVVRAYPTQPRAGQLTAAWQIMVGVTWAAVFFAFAGTWKASEEIGIGTWWLGPRAQPQPLAIRMIPFALSVLVALIAIYNVRRVALFSLAGSFAVALIAVFDITRSGGLAAIEFAIAGAAAVISLGALTGTFRAATDLDDGPAKPPT